LTCTSILSNTTTSHIYIDFILVSAQRRSSSASCNFTLRRTIGFPLASEVLCQAAKLAAGEIALTFRINDKRLLLSVDPADLPEHPERKRPVLRMTSRAVGVDLTPSKLSRVAGRALALAASTGPHDRRGSRSRQAAVDWSGQRPDAMLRRRAALTGIAVAVCSSYSTMIGNLVSKAPNACASAMEIASRHVEGSEVYRASSLAFAAGLEGRTSKSRSPADRPGLAVRRR